VLERRVREPMGTIRGIEVPDNGDAGTVADHRAVISSRAYHEPADGCPLARRSYAERRDIARCVEGPV